MSEYTVKLKDVINEEGEPNVAVSFSSDNMEMVNEESRMVSFLTKFSPSVTSHF